MVSQTLKTQFFGGGDDSQICCCLRMSSPLCRSSGWSSAWCSVVLSATAERSSKPAPWHHNVYLTIIHPGTRKETKINKFLPVTSSPCLNFHSSEFLFHNILLRLIPSRGDSLISGTNVTIFHIYMIFSYGYLDTSTNFNPHTVWVVSASFHTALILTLCLWETSAKGSMVRTNKLSFFLLFCCLRTHTEFCSLKIASREVSPQFFFTQLFQQCYSRLRFSQNTCIHYNIIFQRCGSVPHFILLTEGWQNSDAFAVNAKAPGRALARRLKNSQQV